MTIKQLLDHVLKYWIMYAVIVSGITSVTAAGYKIMSLEDAVKANAEQGIVIHTLEIHQSAIKEQVRAIEESNHRQEMLQHKILDKLLQIK